MRKWFPWERQASLEPNEARLKAKILAWLPQTTTGDRAELRLTGGEEQFWRQIAEEEGACDPGSCVFHQRGQCFLFRARRAAESAHLVVVNHALLLTDAASSNRILPDYDALVVDEAHHLEDQATAQFTVTLSERNLTEYAEAVAGNDGAALSGVAAGAVAFLMGAAADKAGQQTRATRPERLKGALAASGPFAPRVETFLGFGVCPGRSWSLQWRCRACLPGDRRHPLLPGLAGRRCRLGSATRGTSCEPRAYYGGSLQRSMRWMTWLLPISPRPGSVRSCS